MKRKIESTKPFREKLSTEDAAWLKDFDKEYNGTLRTERQLLDEDARKERNADKYGERVNVLNYAADIDNYEIPDVESQDSMNPETLTMIKLDGEKHLAEKTAKARANKAAHNSNRYLKKKQAVPGGRAKRVDTLPSDAVSKSSYESLLAAFSVVIAMVDNAVVAEGLHPVLKTDLEFAQGFLKANMAQDCNSYKSLYGTEAFDAFDAAMLQRYQEVVSV